MKVELDEALEKAEEFDGAEDRYKRKGHGEEVEELDFND